MGGGQGWVHAGRVLKFGGSILRAVESHSGVQSEGSDMADLRFEMVTQATLWRIGVRGLGGGAGAGKPVRRLLEWPWERRSSSALSSHRPLRPVSHPHHAAQMGSKETGRPCPQRSHKAPFSVDTDLLPCILSYK